MTTQPTLQRFCFLKSQTKVSHVTPHSVDLVEEHVLNLMFWPLLQSRMYFKPIISKLF